MMTEVMNVNEFGIEEVETLEAPVSVGGILAGAGSAVVIAGAAYLAC